MLNPLVTVLECKICHRQYSKVADSRGLINLALYWLNTYLR